MIKMVRKKGLSVLCTLIMFCSIFSICLINVDASGESKVQVDGSYLTTDDTSTGSTNGGKSGRSGIGTFSLHLMDGQCSITKSGSGKIYAYAGTTAKHDVDYLSAVMYVDRYDETTKSWGQIYFEQASDYNTYFVCVGKTLSVAKGYYYRVRGTHVAGMQDNPPYEEATSVTDGIWIN